MTIHHPTGNDDLYVIVTDHDAPGRPAWSHRGASLHTPNMTASAEWNILGGHGFGAGIELGRNGWESDLGLNVYAGPLGSLWLRLRAPWTRWAQVNRKSRDGIATHEPRHTGIRIATYPGCIASLQIDNSNESWSTQRAWWREIKLSTVDLTGKTTTDQTGIDSGTCRVPMPEGPYPATYVTERITRRHTRFPGTLIDRWRRQSWISTTIEVPGGIPVEGKGENSWDCGMDGTFGISAPGHVHDVIGSLVASVTRDRARRGGPHDLTAPTTVADAGATP